MTDRTVRSVTTAQGVWGLSDVTVTPPNPAVSHLFLCVINSALSSGRGILLLPITGSGHDSQGLHRQNPRLY